MQKKKVIKTQFTIYLKYYNDYLTFLNLFQVLHQLLNHQHRNLYHYLSSKQLLHPAKVSFLSPIWIFVIQNATFQLLRELRHPMNPNMKRHYVSDISVKFHAIWSSGRPAMMKYVIAPVGTKFGWTVPKELTQFALFKLGHRCKCFNSKLYHYQEKKKEQKIRRINHFSTTTQNMYLCMKMSLLCYSHEN